MNLKDLEFNLSNLAGANILGGAQQEALKCVRDIVAELRAANCLPPGFNSKDLVGLVREKSQNPSLPAGVLRLVSSDESSYDLFATIPGGYGLSMSADVANKVIAEVNQEDHDAEFGGCNDGLSVEENIRRRLEALGFSFVTVIDTVAWDVHHGKV